MELWFLATTTKTGNISFANIAIQYIQVMIWLWNVRSEIRNIGGNELWKK